VAESTVPGSRGWSRHEGARSGGGRGHLEGVEGPRTVTAKKSSPGAEILHRNTERVKLNRNTVISGELTNGKEIFYYVRGKEDVGETERTRNGGVTGADNREGGTITDNDGGGKGGGG
jgi:hypothetical protein